MAKLADNVKDSTTTTGAGTLTLVGTTLAGYRPISAAYNSGDTAKFRIDNFAAGEWEINTGTFSAGTLTRNTPILSSNANAKVNFSAGTKYISIVADVSDLLPDQASVADGLLRSSSQIPYWDSNSLITSQLKYYFGKPVQFSRADINNRVGDVITTDGYHYAKYSLRGKSGVGVSINSTDGFTEISLSGNVDSLTYTSGDVAGGTTNRYYNGKQVTRAWVDINNRASLIETIDGAVYIKDLSIRGKGAISTKANAADGFIEISLGGTFDTVNYTNGDTAGGLVNRYYLGKQVTRAWTDANREASIIEVIDGTVYIPKLVINNQSQSSFLDTPTYVFTTTSIAGKYQITALFKDSGIKTQRTSIGNNTLPALSSDAAKVFYVSDRNGISQSFWQQLDGSKTGGGIEHPVLPFTNLMVLGDSLTSFGYGDIVAATLGTSLLYPSADVRCGIGSQTSTQIAARYGALPITCTLTSNTLTSGANIITAISIPLISRSSDASGTVRTLRASILGITGNLTSLQSPTAQTNYIPYVSGTDWYLYTFTPDSGQTLPASVPAGTTLIIDPQAAQDSCLLVWVGRNDVGQTNWQTTVMTNIAAILSVYKPLIKRIGIISVTNSTSEPTGTANHDAIVAFNATLQSTYPNHYIDVRTPFNNGTPTDIPYPAYTTDGLHYNPTGAPIIAAAVSSFITSQGWLN